MPNHSGRQDSYWYGTARYTFDTPPSGSNTPRIDSVGLGIPQRSQLNEPDAAGVLVGHVSDDP